jgi:hypothetical protein
MVSHSTHSGYSHFVAVCAEGMNVGRKLLNLLIIVIVVAPRGVCHTVALPFTLKRRLKVKKRMMKI